MFSFYAEYNNSNTHYIMTFDFHMKNAKSKKKKILNDLTNPFNRK